MSYRPKRHSPLQIKPTLYIADNGSVRVTKGRGETKANEIAITLNIQVPASLFNKPHPQVDIELPENLQHEVAKVVRVDVGEPYQTVQPDQAEESTGDNQ